MITVLHKQTRSLTPHADYMHALRHEVSQKALSLGQSSPQQHADALGMFPGDHFRLANRFFENRASLVRDIKQVTTEQAHRTAHRVIGADE